MISGVFDFSLDLDFFEGDIGPFDFGRSSSSKGSDEVEPWGLLV